jgi:hypothetical protein
VPTAGGPRGRSLTIGEAVARLAEEFPGLRAETLRVLEQHGLVSPTRTSSGYRRYTERDLTAVRRALSGPPPQRAEPPVAEPARQAASAAALAPAVPVPAALWRAPAAGPRAGAATTAAARGSVPAPQPGPAGAEEALSASSQGAAGSAVAAGAARRRAARWPEPDYFTPELGEVALGREGLARAAGLAEEWVDELAAHGLISGRDPASGADLLVARAAAELLGYGIEPRHLRPVQAAAERAAVLIRAAGGGSSRSGTAQAAAALVRLEAALLRAALLDD